MFDIVKGAYFDCFSGAGGDMIVAALIDAGVDADALRERLSALGLGGYTLTIDKVTKSGFAATRFDVALEDREQRTHRHLQDVVEILSKASISEDVRSRACAVFQRLAEAEARVHATTVDKVHFHEVGAVDAIIDIVGAAMALEMAGIEQVVCSPIPVGSGTVTCEHGVIPIPAPATAELLKGVPIAACDEVGELTTPTAAAVLTTVADRFGPPPAMTIESIGYGAGRREGKTLPNVLRVMVGELVDRGAACDVTVLETNLDDASPEVVAHCMERLFEQGALDVYTVPIQMKKSRSGVVLTVLCETGRADAMEQTMFAETPTLGIRRHDMRRTILRRTHETVSTRFGELRMKVGRRGRSVTASPEYEDCRAAARRCGVPLREVMAAANVAWAASTGS